MKLRLKISKEIITDLVCVSALMFSCSSIFVLGTSAIFQQYEKVAFANAHSYAGSNVMNALIFNYKAKNTITSDERLSEIKDILNDFDGGSKYYNYGCMWGVTPEATIDIGDDVLRYSFADISYLSERPSFSTNLLQLANEMTYDKAFHNEKAISIDGEAIYLKKDNSINISAYYNGKLVDKEIVWEIEDSTLATINEYGRIIALKDGSTRIKATYKETEDYADLYIGSERGFVTKIDKTMPIVIPYSMAIKIAPTIDDSIGCTFDAVINNKTYKVCIGGVYYNQTQEAVFRNKMYFENIGEFIYFERTERYNLPLSEFFITVGNKRDTNMNMYTDIQFIQTKANLKFSIPENMPINNTGSEPIYKKISLVRSPWFIIVGIVIALLAVVLGFFCIKFFKKEIKERTTIYSWLLFVLFIMAPCLVFSLVKSFTVFGVTIFTMTKWTGWLYIVFAIIISIILLFKTSKQSIDNKLIEIDENKKE